MKKGFFQTKRFKYGVVAHSVTALVIVLAVALNVVVYSLASHFGLYTDMTSSDLFTLSDAMKDMLRDTDNEVKIIFCADPDELMADTQYMQYIYKTAENLEAEFDNITVECHDVIKEYNFFKQFKDTEASTIHTDSVIITSGTEFRLMQPEAFFIFDTENSSLAWAYNGEKKFAAAILQVTATDVPKVLFTEQHGETLTSDAAALVNLFVDAGFAVDTVNLAKENIPEDCRIVVINNPRYDFIGMEAESESANEIAKLDNFLDGLGALMVFEDYRYSENLVNLNELLEEWGIGFEHGAYLTDDEHSVSIDGATIVSEYEESGIGASIYMDMTQNLDTMPRTLSKNAMPVNILWEENAVESGTKQVYSVLSSYDTAKLRVDGKTEDAESRSLMAIARDKIIVNNENSLNADYIYSYVFASGCPSFVSDQYLTSNSYGNADIIYAAMRAVGRENLLADLKYKEFDDTELAITTSQATGWTVVFAVIPPAIIGIAGIAVRIKRKNT